MSKKRTYSYNLEDAIKYGTEEATFLNNVRFWLEKNRSNKKAIHDGRVWTYNTRQQYADLFPQWNVRQIDRIIKNLKKAGILIDGYFSSNKYDRTKWYSVNEECYEVEDSEEVIKEELQSDLANMSLEEIIAKYKLKSTEDL